LREKLLEEFAMANTPPNNGKQWIPGSVKELKKLVKENTPTRVAGLKLVRTPGAVQAKASDRVVSLKPTNQGPHCTKK
jgi:hypothetical protein